MFKSFEWSYHTDRHQYYNDFSTRNDLYAKNNPYTVDHKNHPGLFNASGHIGLLGHGAGIKFRNIRIKELPAAKTKK